MGERQRRESEVSLVGGSILALDESGGSFGGKMQKIRRGKDCATAAKRRAKRVAPVGVAADKRAL